MNTPVMMSILRDSEPAWEKLGWTLKVSFDKGIREVFKDAQFGLDGKHEFR